MLAMAVMAVGLSLPGIAHAEGGYLNGSTRKLGRGLANMASAPFELLRESYLTGSKDGGLAGMTVGLVRGIGSVIIREGAGIVEVLTFYMPVPVPDFQPMVKPEFIFVNGNWVE
jgi:putative exosortase-associated protein (TIGR04073 family)